MNTNVYVPQRFIHYYPACFFASSNMVDMVCTTLRAQTCKCPIRMVLQHSRGLPGTLKKLSRLVLRCHLGAHVWNMNEWSTLRAHQTMKVIGIKSHNIQNMGLSGTSNELSPNLPSSPSSWYHIATSAAKVHFFFPPFDFLPPPPPPLAPLLAWAWDDAAPWLRDFSFGIISHRYSSSDCPAANIHTSSVIHH